MNKVKGCIVCNSEEFMEFLKGCNNDLAEVFGMAEESGEAEETEEDKKYIYSYRKVISLAEYNDAVDKAGFLTILEDNSKMDDTALKVMADFANYLGVALFGQAFIDSKDSKDRKTEKEEN